MEEDLTKYLQAWRYRKKYFFLAAIPLALIVTLVALRLPPVFESKSTILVEQQQIPREFVRSIVSGQADQQIQLLTQQILSRPKLLEIINQFGLYAGMRKTTPIDQVLERMRNDIKIKTISAEANGPSRNVTIAFSVAYQGHNPDTVQKVDSALASLYLEQNLKFREAQAQTTTKFLQTELENLREHLHAIGKKIAAFKEAHSGALPELYQFNMSQADHLENNIKRTDSAILAAENQKIYLQGLLGMVDTSAPATASGKDQTLSPRQRLNALEQHIAELRAQFSDDYPDVQRALREKAQLEKLLKQQASPSPPNRQKLLQLQAELAQKRGIYSNQYPEIKKLKAEIAQLKSESVKGNSQKTNVDLANPASVNLATQLKTTINQIESLKKERQNLQAQVKMYHHRLEETPKIEQSYLAMQRDYKNTGATYQEVMNKLLEARIGLGMEEHQKGQKFTLIDPAEYPQTPIKPRRGLIILGGVFMSIVAGLGVMVGAEMMDHSVKTPDELAWLTETAPLGTIANIETPFDVNRKRRVRWLVVIASCGSVFLAILIMHIFYMDLWVAAAKLLRLSHRIS
jgi:polysaccharide biosynthesis transport protein